MAEYYAEQSELVRTAQTVGPAQQACGELLDPLGNVDLLAGVLLLEAVLGKVGVLAEDGSESVPTRTSQRGGTSLRTGAAFSHLRAK